MAARAERPPVSLVVSQGRVSSWLTTVDHKRIGILYIVTSLVFFLAGGVLALLMRAQLATPDEHIVTRNSYNELFTMHGTTMIFLVVVPIWAGLANYLVPLMIGARDMAFPRLNALSYWLFLLGGIILYSSWFAAGGAPRAGWTGYAPLSEALYTPGNGMDLWILSLHVLTLSSLAGAINFLVTIQRLRAPGMTWMRMPLFVWSIEVYAALLVVALPALSAGLTMLLLDRQAGTHFFIPNEGGSALALPARLLVLRPPRGLHHDPARDGGRLRGAPRLLAQADLRLHGDRPLDAGDRLPLRCSSGPTTCSRSGLPGYLQGFFMISSMVIAVPTGIKIFNWLATTWRGNLHFDTPMLFALGFIAIFTIGGLSGIFVAAYPFDWQAPGHVLHRRPPALRALRRLDLRASSRRCTTGGRRSSGSCSASRSARSASG